MKHLVLAALLTTVSISACADEEHNFAQQYTKLDISETARKMTEQDRFKASLRIASEGKSAEEVQGEINMKMAEALRYAKQFKDDVNYQTSGYHVNSRRERVRGENSRLQTTWYGGQAMEMDSANMVQILKLVGILQKQGFSVSNLTPYLSTDKREQVQSQLMDKAVNKLTEKARRMGKLIGRENVRFEIINYDVPNYYSPRPRMEMMAMAVKSADMAEPVIEAGESEVQVTVRATVQLSK